MPKHLYLYVGTVSQEFLSKLSISCRWNRQKLPRVPTCNYIHGDIFVPFQTFCLLENTWLGHLFCFHLGVHAWLGSDNGTGRFPFYCWECDHLFENAEIELPKYSPRSFFDLNHWTTKEILITEAIEIANKEIELMVSRHASFNLLYSQNSPKSSYSNHKSLYYSCS